MNKLHPLIDFPVTKYYFDTFIVGAHHSVPHLIKDLLSRKELAESALDENIPNFKKQDLVFLVSMINAKLKTLDIQDLDKLEDNEPVFWVNSLARKSALEISTYGRVRPETMDMLMCLDDDQFIAVMNIAGKLSTKIQQLGEYSLANMTAVPPSMPVVS